MVPLRRAWFTAFGSISTCQKWWRISSYFRAVNVYETSAGSHWCTRLQSISSAPQVRQRPCWCNATIFLVCLKQCNPFVQSELVHVIFRDFSVPVALCSATIASHVPLRECPQHKSMINLIEACKISLL